MKYVLEIDPSVTREARRIYAYREEERPRSGERFVAALIECYARIRENPFGFQLRKGIYRHAMLRQLKYRLVFAVEGQVVEIHQVRHTSRRVSRKFGP